MPAPAALPGASTDGTCRGKGAGRGKGQGKKGKGGRGDAAKGDGKAAGKGKDAELQEPRVKNAVQEAKKVMKTAADQILECRSWDALLANSST
ncbi:unnamed protein product [Symbiodinium necroappetens]|uniref:Uncharacterized protein n=1 Tax=Symbiodinium necroappetens TaxID=1628268 RepID=A0A813BTQ4_9DINO|nr:unnamed protein product [Symbiodinium necroappetens]